MSRQHINPLQWHQAVEIARQSCARFFRDGGSPADALGAFGVPVEAHLSGDWVRRSMRSPKSSARRPRGAPPSQSFAFRNPARLAPAAMLGLFFCSRRSSRASGP